MSATTTPTGRGPSVAGGTSAEKPGPIPLAASNPDFTVKRSPMEDLNYRICHESEVSALVQPLSVLVDDQVFLLQNAGGISRYFAELAHAFGRDPELGVEMTIPLGHTTNTHLQQRRLALPIPMVGGTRGADLARRIHRRLSRDGQVPRGGVRVALVDPRLG